MFSIPSNPIMDAIEKLYDISKDAAFAETTYCNNKNEVDLLKDFWDCNEEQAVFMALLVQSYFEDKPVSINELLTYTDSKTSIAPYVVNQLTYFIENKCVTPIKDLKLHPLTSLSISNSIINSVINQEKYIIVNPQLDTSFKLLQQFQIKLIDRINRRITYDEFVNWTFTLVNVNSSIELADFIIKSNMDAISTSHFVYACNRYYNGYEFTDFDDINRDLSSTKEEQYKLRQSFKNGTNFLIKNGFLKESYNNYDMMTNLSYKLTSKSIEAFDKTAIITDKIQAKMFDLINPDNIIKKELIFDIKEQKLINKLNDLFTNDNFDKLIKRLEHNGMKKGVSVLLYGHPGTGKTECVLQLAKYCNRTILMADASKIRSKWVGETEKNMKALFDEYKLIKDSSTITPILLFNEADAILGKRREVEYNVDQMENTMQNILLQELENFEGIFLATTNQVENLDSAFDRRFLYKIKFDKPSALALQKIWQAKLPALKKNVIKKLCALYSLSGGQIDNLSKKIMVDQLLNEDLDLNETYLNQICDQELVLEKKIDRNPIGFNLN